MQGCWDADVLWLSLSWGRCIHPIFPSHLGCYDKQTETSRPSEMPGIFRLLFVWASASDAAHRSQIEAVVSVGVVAWLWQEGAEIKACSKKGERQRDTEREMLQGRQGRVRKAQECGKVCTVQCSLMRTVMSHRPWNPGCKTNLYGQSSVQLHHSSSFRVHTLWMFCAFKDPDCWPHLGQTCGAICGTRKTLSSPK